MTEPAQPERFRILIIGRGNAGKTTILRAVCGVDEEPEVYDGEGNKITPVVHVEEVRVPEVDHVEEAVAETHEDNHPEEAVTAVPVVPEPQQPEEVAPVEVSEAHHSVDGQANQATPVQNRSALRSAWRLICARLMCRAPDSILASHLEELHSAMSSPRTAPGSILAVHPEDPVEPEEPENLNLAPSLASRKEPMSILSPTALRGEHRIDWELIFPSNSRFVFHDSCGFESGGVQEVEWVRKFIQDKAGLGSMSKQLHAIWYCFPADNTRLITAAEKEFFNKIDTGSVPVIAIITKFDALDAAACTSLLERGVPFEVAQEIAHLYATETFNKGSLPILEALAHRPKAVVHLRKMHDMKSPAAMQKAVSELIQSTAASLDSDALKMLLVQAQRVNVELCMKGAVNSGAIMKAAQDAAEEDVTWFDPLEKKLIQEIFRWFPSIWEEDNLREIRKELRYDEDLGEALEEEEKYGDYFDYGYVRLGLDGRFVEETKYEKRIVLAATGFIESLKPLISESVTTMDPPLQVLFVGITAVIIAADSFWPKSGNSSAQPAGASMTQLQVCITQIQDSMTQYFKSGTAEHVRTGILEALSICGGTSADISEASLAQIALNNYGGSP